MNKRQRKKCLEREKRYMIKSIDFLEKSYTLAANQMREEYNKTPLGFEKTCHDFYIGGFEYAVKMFADAKRLIKDIGHEV